MKNKVITLIVYFVFISNAFSEESYVGASIGDSKVSVDNYNKPIAYKVYFGAFVNDKLGVEIGLIDLGEFSRSNQSNKVSGTELSAVGFIPIANDGNFFGKLGIFNWKIESTFASSSTNTDGTDYTIGLGMQFPIKDNILFRIEYQEFREIDDSNDDFTFLSLGVTLAL